ncbi:MAG: hypothetical protein AB8H86_26210 [Polyangiales bacterium]
MIRQTIVPGLALVLMMGACGGDNDASDSGADSPPIDATERDGSELDSGGDDAGRDANPEDTGNADAADSGPIDDGPLKAFPSAYGGGAIATGGRRDAETTQLILVDTLDADADLVEVRPRVWRGGLDAALTQNIGTPRFVVFNVSGQVDVGLTPGPDGDSRSFGEGISTEEPNGASDMTILGQTAPEGGVTIINGYIHIKRNRNIILRYLTSRPKLITGNPITDDRRSTGISLPGREVIIDHCSSSWGGDKSIIMADWQPGYPNRDSTLQRSIAAESATLVFSVDGIDSGEDDWDIAGNISILSNLVMGGHRTPNLGGFNGYGEIRNNVIISRGSRLANIVYGSPSVNYQNNYIFHRVSISRNNWQRIGDVDVDLFADGNYYEELEGGVILDGDNTQAEEHSIWTMFGTSDPVPASFFEDAPVSEESIEHPMPLLGALEARASVLGDVGNNRYLDDDGVVQRHQDSYDLGAIADANAGELRFNRDSSTWEWPTVPSNTRPDSYDTDNDGMADAWEMRTFGSLDEDFFGDADGDGYLNIEEYANQVDR